MTNITLDTAIHRGKQILLLKYLYNNQLINITRQLTGATWSNTYNSWYVPYSSKALLQVKQLFEGVAQIDATILKEKLRKLKNTTPYIKANVLGTDGTVSIEKFKQWLRSRRYSDSTIGTYTNVLDSFLKYYHNKPINEITNDDIIKYNNEYILANKLSASFQNQVVNAIKLFFQTIENKTINIDLVHRPKRAKLLPNKGYKTLGFYRFSQFVSLIRFFKVGYRCISKSPTFHSLDH